MAGIIAQVGHFLLRGAATAAPGKIFHFYAPCVDLKGRFRFEWHTENQKLYVVDIALGEKTKRVVANLMAHNIENEGAAYNAALCWCRGFLAAEQGRSHNDQGKLVLLGEHS
jgi:hypothetical protein